MDFETLRDNTARVIKFIRKSHGLSQYDLAQLMEVSQANVSKYESKQLIPSASEWAILCLKTDTPLDSNVHGFVDKLQRVSVAAKSPVNYKIHKKYTYQSNYCNRFIAPLYYAGKELLGDKIDEKLKAKKNDPVFFLGLGMPVNDAFIAYLIDIVEKESGRGINEIPLKNHMLTELSQGKLHAKVAHKNKINGIKNFCSNSLLYSNAFNYEFKSDVANEQFVFQSTLKERETSTVACDYNLHFSKSLLEAILDGSNKKVELKEKTRDDFTLVFG